MMTGQFEMTIRGVEYDVLTQADKVTDVQIDGESVTLSVEDMIELSRAAAERHFDKLNEDR